VYFLCAKEKETCSPLISFFPYAVTSYLLVKKSISRLLSILNKGSKNTQSIQGAVGSKQGSQTCGPPKLPGANFTIILWPAFVPVDLCYSSWYMAGVARLFAYGPDFRKIFIAGHKIIFCLVFPKV